MTFAQQSPMWPMYIDRADARTIWNDALELAAMKIEKMTERSRIVDAGINGKVMQPCPYAAEIRALKAKP